MIKQKMIFLVFSLCAYIPAHADNTQPTPPQTLAPGYNDLRFPAPIPGTYKLPDLGLASDGDVLDSGGRSTTLHSLMSDKANPNKIILLSFIYATCSDVNGCPLATAVFHKIKNRLEKEPDLAANLRLLTLSFNPEHDTPERMKVYGANLQGKGVEWHFLTTRSEKELQPILKNYKQNIEKIYDKNGKFTDTFNHSLRVYLIDQHKQIRNIYNTELLHPDTLIADVKTLLQPETKPLSPVPSSNKNSPNVYSAGDNKRAYESKDYQTKSVALTQRKGKAADLTKTITQPPLGLPKVPVPNDNPITAEKIALGRKLFYDRRLSLNNTFSCALCHIPEQGFTSNEMATAVGIEGRTVRRNSPALYNVAYMESLFHDSRETTLENQVWGPLLAHNEMANPSIGYVIDKIKLNKDYDGLFETVFGKPPGMEAIGMAIASYERTLNSANSPFDRWYYGKNKQTLDVRARRGFQLFTGKAGCSQCHSITKDFALFTDNSLHNTGIGFKDAMTDKQPTKTKRVQVAPGVYVDVPSRVIESVSEIKANDIGRYEVTQKPADRWRYKTPSLRNISLTVPYMHNGSIATLREVVEFYNRGGIANENLDPLIEPLHLSPTEINDLTAFLESLTGDNVEELVSDAFAAPIGDRD
jgi:cytochrome c peroxidase